MAYSLPTLIRFLLPQQLVARYMESKIPLPTDNIFKFYALFSLLLLFFSAGSLIYVQEISMDWVRENGVEYSLLVQDEALTPEKEIRKELLAKELASIASDRKLYSLCIGALIGTAFVGLWYGFSRWHTKIQPLLDEQLQLQVEISRLQLAKLQAELKTVAKGEGRVDESPSPSGGGAV